MKNLSIGVVCGILLLLAGEFLFAIEGGMPVATQAPPLPLEKYIAHKAIHAKVDPEAGRASPLPADEANRRRGAEIYGAQCAVCHGQANRPMSAIATGMFPRPPQLFPWKKHPVESPAGGIYWRVKYGIRMTGMPGYGDSLTDTEMWQVSQFWLHPLIAEDLVIGKK